MRETWGVSEPDVRTGQPVALPRFGLAVQKVFVLPVLPGRRDPDLIDDERPWTRAAPPKPKADESGRSAPRGRTADGPLPYPFLRGRLGAMALIEGVMRAISDLGQRGNRVLPAPDRPAAGPPRFTRRSDRRGDR